MATIPDIDTRAYLTELRALARRWGLDIRVEIVPNIQDWCQAHGVPEDNPFRAGKIVQNDQSGQYVILVPETITTDMVSSVITAMECRGFATDVDLLSGGRAFLQHLVLHEIAHGLDHARSEEACDQWAFEQLRQLPSNPALNTDAAHPRRAG